MIPEDEQPQPAAGLEEARAIVQRAEQELEQPQVAEEAAGDASVRKAGVGRRLLKYAVDKACSVDHEAAVRRAAQLRSRHPDESAAYLCERLIKAKCQKTALVGGATAAPSAIPGIGTLVSLTVGTVVDIGSTINTQAELVLEIAAVYGIPLDEDKRREVILVVTGLGTGAQQLAGKAGQRVGQKLGQRYAQGGIARALPIIGVAAAASTNVLATYVIGRRAQAYFGKGADTVGDWQESLRAISGVDERKIAAWLAESRSNLGRTVTDAGRSVGDGVRKGADAVAAAGRSASDAIVSAADKAGETVTSTGKALGEGAKRATEALGSTADKLQERTRRFFTRNRADDDQQAPQDETEAPAEGAETKEPPVDPES